MVSAVDERNMDVEHEWTVTEGGKPECSKKSFHFVHKNPTRTNQESNPGLSHDRSMIDNFHP
jgi:hypothetical protein